MTKAEKIFADTRYACKKHLNDWGYQVNPNGKAVSFNSLSTEEVVYIRTINEVQKILDSKRKTLSIDRKLNVSTPDKLDIEEQVLNMVETALNNHRKHIEEFEAKLKAL